MAGRGSVGIGVKGIRRAVAPRDAGTVSGAAVRGPPRSGGLRGPVRVRGLRGPVRVRGLRGPVRVRGLRGPVRVRGPPRSGPGPGASAVPPNAAAPAPPRHRLPARPPARAVSRLRHHPNRAATQASQMTPSTRSTRLEVPLSWNYSPPVATPQPAAAPLSAHTPHSAPSPPETPTPRTAPANRQRLPGCHPAGG